MVYGEYANSDNNILFVSKLLFYVVVLKYIKNQNKKKIVKFIDVGLFNQEIQLAAPQYYPILQGGGQRAEGASNMYCHLELT